VASRDRTKRRSARPGKRCPWIWSPPTRPPRGRARRSGLSRSRPPRDLTRNLPFRRTGDLLGGGGGGRAAPSGGNVAQVGTTTVTCTGTDAITNASHASFRRERSSTKPPARRAFFSSSPSTRTAVDLQGAAANHSRSKFPAHGRQRGHPLNLGGRPHLPWRANSRAS